MSEYTRKMMRIRSLSKAGYPFGKNDLTREEWEDLVSLDNVLTEIENKQPRPFYMVEMKQ
ncbi:MAG: hypothetical protein WC374_10065 [Phycisphaerae bacterium]